MTKVILLDDFPFHRHAEFAGYFDFYSIIYLIIIVSNYINNVRS